ncbi:MAG: tetratricopeptide repeat protein [candidate division Zixibacteria bacterium]|nr:tetratricopeptide repeat protein [Candidatus Tariuqbacter arcticus]
MKLFTINNFKNYSFINVVLVLIILAGCATTSMMITVKRPAEVNLKGYEKIAIGTISGTDSRDIEDALTTELFASGRFEVLDRNHLQQILREHNLNLTGAIDQTTAAELGKFIGTAVLVFGRVQTNKTDDNVTKGEPWQDKKGGWHQNYTREVNHILKVNLQIVDMQTAKILAVRNLTAEKSAKKYADKKTPEEIDYTPLKSACIHKIISDFMKTIAPYDIQLKATFQKDKNLPEVESAITQLKIGEWDEALNLFRKAVDKQGLDPKIQAKAYYNLGLAQMYGGIYEESLKNLKKAMSLQPNNKMYQKVFTQCKDEKDKADKLEEQL